MKKNILLFSFFLIFIGNINAQPWRRQGKDKIQLSTEQQAKVQSIGERINKLSPQEKEAMYALRGQRRKADNSKLEQLPTDRQAEIKAIQQAVQALSKEERWAVFQQFGVKPPVTRH